jgi:hypothetical protein
MPRALVVADEVDERMSSSTPPAASVDLIIAAGDLPFDYLDFLADAYNRPCVFVPGNHDPDLGGFDAWSSISTVGGFPADWPGPQGGLNADGRVVEIAGLRIAGLGGSVRYNDGPNQWTQSQQTRRARKLVRAAIPLHKRLRRSHWNTDAEQEPRRPVVDILLTHAPPRGVGDRDDPCHQGFDCLHHVVDKLAPTMLLHGHIHPYGERIPEYRIGHTRVINVVGARIMDLPALTEGVGHGS